MDGRTEWGSIISHANAVSNQDIWIKKKMLE